ncbi:hypothetical protein FRC12_018589 [Ceratobasidium sp. 428]|nr:hypothetical protein FRC12_018589 [Ceratobasidium sp. 428]
MDEFEDDGDFAIQTLKRLAVDEMPYDSRHRHSSSAGIYHMQATVFSSAATQASTLRILDTTFRHESLILVLADSGLSHPARDIAGVIKIVRATSSGLLDALERASQGESIGPLRLDNDYSPYEGQYVSDEDVGYGSD